MKNPAEEAQNDQAESQAQDAEAVSRTLAGQTRAFDELIEKYQRRAVSVSYRLLGNLNDAMDVCQEAFVKAFRSLGTLQDPRRFGAWLMRIVGNLSLNYRRGRKQHLSLSLGDEDESGPTSWLATDEHSNPTGAGAAVSEETQRMVNRAMEELPPPQRMALVLFAIEGLPQKDVAEIMQCSVEMVKWNVFQARKALKEKLSEYLEE